MADEITPSGPDEPQPQDIIGTGEPDEDEMLLAVKDGSSNT
jgi:hypothetical protein